MYRSNHYQTEDDMSMLVAQYAPLVQRIAKKVASRCPSSVELDDLIQSGVIGLIQAKHSYNEQAGSSFKTYASMKIQYAVYEDVRKHSGITREISQYIKKIAAAISQIEQRAEVANHQTIVETLGVTEQQYQSMNDAIKAHKTLSFEDMPMTPFADETQEDSPFQWAVKAEISEKLREVTALLPKREQLILALYYNEFLNFKEIAEILDLTEARVSQIHNALIKKLKLRMASIEVFLEK